jgi:hypothetical protein
LNELFSNHIYIYIYTYVTYILQSCMYSQIIYMWIHTNTYTYISPSLRQDYKVTSYIIFVCGLNGFSWRIFLFFLLFIFYGAQNQTHGLERARQVLLSLSYIPSPCFVWDRVSPWSSWWHFSLYLVQAHAKFAIPLPLPPKCWVVGVCHHAWHLVFFTQLSQNASQTGAMWRLLHSRALYLLGDGITRDLSWKSHSLYNLST